MTIFGGRNLEGQNLGFWGSDKFRVRGGQNPDFGGQKPISALIGRFGIFGFFFRLLMWETHFGESSSPMKRGKK